MVLTALVHKLKASALTAAAKTAGDFNAAAPSD
jgi:hypothetical protein